MKASQTNIRRMTTRYKAWLQSKQWFNLNVTNKDEWLEPLDKIITKTSCTPSVLWEAVVDHWQATNWDEGSFPKMFEELYEMVDEYRSNHNVDGTDNINLLIDALKQDKNQSLVANTVISELYERLTGNVLLQETDPENGEEYEYKHGDDVCMTSTALHPEVKDFFGFKSNRLVVDDMSLFHTELKNWELANIIRERHLELFSTEVSDEDESNYIPSGLMP